MNNSSFRSDSAEIGILVTKKLSVTGELLSDGIITVGEQGPQGEQGIQGETGPKDELQDILVTDNQDGTIDLTFVTKFGDPITITSPDIREEVQDLTVVDNEDGTFDLNFIFKYGPSATVTTPDLRDEINNITLVDNEDGTYDIVFDYKFAPSQSATIPEFREEATNVSLTDNLNGTFDITFDFKFGQSQTITTPDLTGPAGSLGSIVGFSSAVLTDPIDLVLPIQSETNNSTFKTSIQAVVDLTISQFTNSSPVMDNNFDVIGNLTTDSNLTVKGNAQVDGFISSLSQATQTNHAVLGGRNIIAGDGLSGGGDLTENRTIDVDSTVVRTSGNQTISGEKEFNDEVTFNGLTNLNTYCEDVVSETWSSATQTINLATALVHNITITANVTSLTFSNAPSGKATSFTLILNQSSNANTVTWPASVKWADDNLQPTINIANRTFILSFMTPNGGTTWYGFLAGGDFI